MTKRFLAVLAALALALGLAMVGASPAQAAFQPNSVNNSGYSNQNILACDPGVSCLERSPGFSVYQVTPGGWSPDVVAVCPYCVAKYRAVAPGGYVTGWVELHGGRRGAWIDSGAVFRMWGQGTEVQVIMAGPFY